MSDFDVAVIGGGAAGLMCAITAGRRGRRVLVIESSNKVGKKILMSGGGRCNFTNLNVDPDNFLCANPHFSKSALSRYTQWDFIASVQKHGIPYHERKHGQLFCDNSSKDILTMLLSDCADVGVTIGTECFIDNITPNKPERSRFELSTSAGQFTAGSLVVATGGLSIPKMGASGFGYDIARQFGMKLIETRAGLAPFVFSNAFKAVCERLAGVALDCEIHLDANANLGRKETVTFSEALLFTHRGISGPAVLQISNYWTPGESAVVNLLPSFDLRTWFKASKTDRPKLLLRSLLSQRLPKSLVTELEHLYWSKSGEIALAEWSDGDLDAVARNLNHCLLKPSGTEGYRTAEVTIGGIDTDEISSQAMESKRQPGLYFIGEVVDVTGHLGGFNFQWAWASGYAAGSFA
jgi:predicted Rossmann fold flavoprotein